MKHIKLDLGEIARQRSVIPNLRYNVHNYVN